MNFSAPLRRGFLYLAPCPHRAPKAAPATAARVLHCGETNETAHMMNSPKPPLMVGRLILLAVLLMVAAVVVVKIIPDKSRSVAAKNNPKNECAYSAAVQHNNAKLVLSQAATGLSVASTVAERRLEEQFFVKFATCLLPDPTASLYDLQFASVFDSCLRDEALEKYDAVLRE
jgi:hypothetical protein